MLHYSLWEMPVRGRTVTRNLNTSKNEASGDSAGPICKVKASVDSFFIELSTAICFMSVLLARAEIFTIYCRPLEVCNRYIKGVSDTPF